MYKKPKILYKENGELRKIGFEIEFGNLDSYKVVDIIAGLYGGEVKKYNRYYLKLINTSKGDFTIKIDTSFLYEKKYNEIFRKLGIRKEHLIKHKEFIDKLEGVLEDVFSTVMPYEIALPPVSIEEIHVFDPLIDALRENHAKGTADAPVNAYATHINAELPAFNLNTINDYLKAFLLLYPWLMEKMNIELSRRLSSFINPFPDKYVDIVLKNNYYPEINEFIEDYKKYNPDRNRPLDLYPVLAKFNPELQYLEKTGNVKPRRTLHFRLPDSRIDDPGWSLASEWNYWWYIEYLSNEKDELHALIEEYRVMRTSVWFGLERKWKNRISDWIKPIES